MEILALSAITADPDLQARVALDGAVVAEYAEAMRSGEVFPPIVVFRDGTDTWLADGFHRYHAARDAGLSDIAADVRAGTRRDALLHAAGANGTHGLRRTNADKRRAVELLLSDPEWYRWSDREIARRCAVSHEFARRVRDLIRQPLTDSGERLARRGDAIYAMRTGAIGGAAFGTGAAWIAEAFTSVDVATLRAISDEMDAATRAGRDAEKRWPPLEDATLPEFVAIAREAREIQQRIAAARLRGDRILGKLLIRLAPCGVTAQTVPAFLDALMAVCDKRIEELGHEDAR